MCFKDSCKTHRDPQTKLSENNSKSSFWWSSAKINKKWFNVINKIINQNEQFRKTEIITKIKNRNSVLEGYNEWNKMYERVSKVDKAEKINLWTQRWVIENIWSEKNI